MDGLSLPYCKNLYDYLIKWGDFLSFKLEFSPDQPGFEGQSFFINEDTQNQTVELVCFKSTFLKVFAEAHNNFNKYVSHSIESPIDWDVYYMTIGYLMTTPENKTILNLHEDCVLKLLSQSPDRMDFLTKELLVTQSLLTSTRNSLNKSSSMWYWYRKLYILFGQHTAVSDETLLMKWIPTFKNSAELHKCNYYCWNTVRWFFDIVPSLKVKTDLFEMTKEFCFKHVSDCSSWDTLGYIVSHQQENNKFNFKNYTFLQKRYQSNKNLNTSVNLTPPASMALTLDIESIINELVRYIDLLPVKDWTVFVCLSRIINSSKISLDNHIRKCWLDQISKFEDRQGSISYKNMNPIVPLSKMDDLTISNQVLHFGWKKRFLKTI
ncbi:similar to Saccharomyces cerevisiae YKR004C ECM9 Non-essential protein of unknown function [Maudiozyma saulgeensis]|uniref:Uncharacterized protein n=1 Tax=Maudiozyma saulgeensis TaxID=1789683 RepID=A0A1X7QWD3_9SACH|nr:similar to Saccharomyces cerevisiae YKR004C ECM9 Non-essential protein of unknown function [Kazachstania saulgeensis]